jgi:hypothetical protein
MHYCRSLNDVDNKKIRMCRYCNIMLEDERERMEKQAKAVSQAEGSLPDGHCSIITEKNRS